MDQDGQDLISFALSNWLKIVTFEYLYYPEVLRMMFEQE